jgi:hypothetical protein
MGEREEKGNRDEFGLPSGEIVFQLPPLDPRRDGVVRIL